MSRVRDIEPKVETILKYNPIARKDDFILVLEVYRYYIPSCLTLNEALTRHKEIGLPSFESITRARRKLQSKDPSLCDATAVSNRAEAEADYRDYAREF